MCGTEVSCAGAVNMGHTVPPGFQPPGQPNTLLPSLVQDAYSLLPGHPLLALACEGHAALLAKVLDNGGNADAQDSRGLTGAAWQPQVQGGKCTAGAVLVCGLVLQEWR